MKQPRSQHRSDASHFWVVGVVLLAVVAISVTNAWRDYDNTLEQEFRLLEVHARQREVGIQGALESVNLMLGNIVADFAEKPTLSTPEKTRLLQDALRQLPQLRSLVITSAAGRITASNNEQLIGFDASQREYFNRHRAAPLDHSFHIVVPFKTVTGVFATTLSRSIVDQDRRFAGVAVATFDGSFFSKTLEYTSPSPDAQALLAHAAGVILSAVPSTQLAGQSIADGPAFSAHLAGAQASSRHTTVSKLSQVKRLAVVHNVGTAPLKVIVSRDYDAAIAEWRHTLLIHIASFLGLCTITLVASGLAWRRQRALLAREHFIKSVTDAMPGMVGYWDQNLRCQFANRTYLEWFGKSPDAIVGQTALSLFGAVLLEKNEPLMRAALDGKPQDFERTLTKADGSVGYAYAHYIPDVSDDGMVAGFFVLVTDVTPLKLAEVKVRESEAFTRGVLDSLTEHVAVLNANGEITAVNAAWEQFAINNGATERSKVSVGANYLRVCADAAGAPDGVEGANVLAGIRKVLDGSQPDFTLEYPCHKPTVQRWFVLRTLPLRGSSPGAVLIHQDVTGRHQADALLRASEQHFRMLAENMADMVWKADAQMRFTYLNGADQRIRGFESDEVLGHSIAEALTPQGKDMLAALVQERRTAEAKGQKGIALVYEIPMRCKDGGQVWMEISTTPFYDDGGAIIGFQGVGRDISERKRRELYLLESQHQMENHLHDVEEEKSKLQEQVVRDPLTGVFNRRFLDDMLPLELSRAAREGYPVAIIMLDLDHFKRVNDRYSHAAGDEVLKSFTALLRQGARDSDMVCRYGGEEFVVIMPRMSVERAVERVNAWRAEVQVMVIAYGDDRIRVTVSGGISGFPRDGDTPELLLARADEMLYFSKREGRNRITVYGNVNDNRSKLLL